MGDSVGAGDGDRHRPERCRHWGAPFLEPTFVVDAPPSLPRSAGDYKIEGRNAGGPMLFSLRFDIPEMAADVGGSSCAFIQPMKPEWSGPGESVTLDEDTDRPVTLLRNPRNGGVTPTALTQGNRTAALPLDPELEMWSSRGIPDPQDWIQ